MCAVKESKHLRISHKHCFYVVARQRPSTLGSAVEFSTLQDTLINA